MKDRKTFYRKDGLFMYNYNGFNNYNQNLRPQQPILGLRGRPVSSLQEAQAASIDFDGSIFFFPDLANNKIYTKNIQNDGTAKMNMYELKEMPTEPSPIEYVSRQEFTQALEELKEAIGQKTEFNI